MLAGVNSWPLEAGVLTLMGFLVTGLALARFRSSLDE
jgi:hypothetical protein